MNTFIGYAASPQIRYRATSGGIGSALIKYLFEKNIIDSALSFEFNPENLEYVPKIIYNFKDYQMYGSIYQEIDLVKFLKNHRLEIVKEKRGKIALFCLPCQTRSIRNLMTKLNKEVFIIGLACSSQQTLEATHYLLQRLHININDILRLQYRGNGWPSGIQIKKKNGEDIFIPNNNSLWTQIFHSRLFIRPKCFRCQDTLNKYSDIVLADPWLKEYITIEKEGQTLFATYTKIGQDIIENALNAGAIIAKPINEDLLFLSQHNTIIRKESYKAHPIARNLINKLFASSQYKAIVLATTPSFNLHCKIKAKIEFYLAK